MRTGILLSRLTSILAVGLLLGACRETTAPMAPAVDGPQLSRSPGDGLHGAIIFHSDRAGTFDIFVMNADGSGVTQLTNTTGQDFDPFWSPSGQRIAFNRIDGGTFQILVMSADGSEVTQLASNGFAKAWSPDGRRIAFVSNRNGNDDVFIMNADGSGVVQLTDNPAVDDPTAWSPDGKQILLREADRVLEHPRRWPAPYLRHEPGRDRGHPAQLW